MVQKLAITHTGLVFIRRFQNAISKNSVLPRGSKIIIAVSGGPDSMTLLTLLNRLKAKHDFELHAAHVNYGLRGRDSDNDERLVEKICSAYQIPLSTFHPTEKPIANIEATLRVIRYRFFERIRKKHGFDLIVTAHTMNDLAETFLLNLMRGSGLIGLSPFKRAHSNIVRPLVSCTREDIESFLTSEGILSRQDKSNNSKRFTRNRIRHELLPILKTFNPNIIATLAKTVSILGEKHESDSRK